MNFRTDFTALVLASALALGWSSGAQAADPLTNFLDSVFHPVVQQTAELHPAAHVGRRTTHWNAWSDTYRQRNAMWRASWYGGGERLNARTSSGERFRPMGLTAAHRTLPLGTQLQVCFRGCAVVRVNDRGPAAWTGRSLDLSRGAAAAIGMLGAGDARVQVAILN